MKRQTERQVQPLAGSREHKLTLGLPVAIRVAQYVNAIIPGGGDK